MTPPQNTPEDYAKENLVETVLSYAVALQKAGGNVRFASPEELKRMTAWDLVNHMAPNGIRFFRSGPAVGVPDLV